MQKKQIALRILAASILVLLALGTSAAQFQQINNPEPLASVSTGWREVYFRPKVSYAALILAVSQPDGTVFEKTFVSGSTPVYDLPANAYDGTYTYELRLVPSVKQPSREEIKEDAGSENDARSAGLAQKDPYGLKPNVQSGHFVVRGGSIQKGGGVERSPSDKLMTIQDVTHLDDVVITGSLGVGFDVATDGSESWGYDTIRLKENNLRIHFDDTSIGTFPTNDWRIRINDTTSGGASYFAIEDATNASTPFKLEADAPSNSLYVDDYGRVGFGTAAPAVELHSQDGDTPTLRLQQDGSYGWTPQTWDVAGNESNFFIRDVTNGSKLSFRIQPGTPSSTLCLKGDGSVGIGTWSPGYAMELEKTGENAAFVLDRTDGAMNYINATDSFGNFGTVNNYPLRLVVDSAWRMRLNADNSLTMKNGAALSSGGVWQNASSRALKENIEDLPSDHALEALEKLNPVTFNYKANQEESHVGFIAEDVPDLVASNDREKMSSMDVVAVLTKVVQEQQKTIDELQKRLSELERLSQIEKQ
jgi:hypothetical protein